MLGLERRHMIKNLRKKGLSISDIARRSGYGRKTAQGVLRDRCCRRPSRETGEPRLGKAR
jgi:lambda repressor-like predicted transcriptional regulator